MPKIIINIGNVNKVADVRNRILIKKAKDYNNIKPVIPNNNYVNRKM